MTRTIVSLDPQDKEWLDRMAKERDVPMTQIVRDAVRRLRREWSAESPDFKEILRQTSGIWRKGDGLDYQRMRRREWQGRR
ncbi:MAG: ribbon-helix-helix protein, CopG family [Acidobacteria bacterium]|nr:ribbon-helix-helix protein, CopG family [Acidobacteriota bacterium]